MIMLKSEIPEYLTASQFYRQLENNELFRIQDKFFKSNDSINNIEDFVKMVDITLFWDTDEINHNFYDFYQNNPEIILDYYKEFFESIMVEHIPIYEFFEKLTKMVIKDYNHFIVNGKILDMLYFTFLSLKTQYNMSKSITRETYPIFH